MTNDNKQKNNQVAECLCLTGGMCLMIMLGVGYITWSIYTIIGLTQVSDDILIKEHCGSLLWRYNLTMIILVVVQAISSKPKDNEENTIVQLSGLICSYFVSIGLASWGTYEVLGRSCSDSLAQYTIYTTGYIMVITQWVFIISLTLIAFISSLCCCLMAKNKKPPTPVPTNHLTYGTNQV